MPFKIPLIMLSLILIAGCGQRADKASPNPAPTATAMPAAPPEVSTDELAFRPCIEAAAGAQTNGVNVSEQGLRAMLQMADCSESYLVKFPEGSRAHDAERLRIKALKGAMDVLASLERPVEGAAEGTTGQAAQALLVSRENIKKLALENARHLTRAINFQTIKTARALFIDLKTSGIKMSSAVGDFNMANVSRRQTGVWELTMDRSYDDGEFIVISESLTRSTDASFGVAGFGVVSPTTYIQDESLDDKGRFSAECRVKISMIEGTLDFPCKDYLDGLDGTTLSAAMKKQLMEGMQKRAAQGNT